MGKVNINQYTIVLPVLLCYTFLTNYVHMCFRWRLTNRPDCILVWSDVWLIADRLSERDVLWRYIHL